MVVFREQLRPHIIHPGLVRTENKLIQKFCNAYSNNIDFIFLVAKLKDRCALLPSSYPSSYNKTFSCFLLAPLGRTLFPFLWHYVVIYVHIFFQKCHFSSPHHCSYLKSLPLNTLGLHPVLCRWDTILPCSAECDFFSTGFKDQTLIPVPVDPGKGS